MQYKNIHRIEEFKNIQEPRVENTHFFKNNSRSNKIQEHSRTFKDLKDQSTLNWGLEWIEFSNEFWRHLIRLCAKKLSYANTLIKFLQRNTLRQNTTTNKGNCYKPQVELLLELLLQVVLQPFNCLSIGRHHYYKKEHKFVTRKLNRIKFTNFSLKVPHIGAIIF